MNVQTPMPVQSPDRFSCSDSALINDWHVVGFSKDLEVGKLVPVRLLGRDLVMWRSSDGVPHIWEDLCIHRGAKLSKGWIEKDVVICPYHGWRYDGSASCVLIPSAPDEPPPRKARAFPFKAVELFGMIWATIGNPMHDIPQFLEWKKEGFRVFHAGPYYYNANGFRSVENFIDATHFPFVHAGLNGVQDNPDKIEPYEVTQETDGSLTTSEIVVFQPYGDHRQVPVEAGVHLPMLPASGRLLLEARENQRLSFEAQKLSRRSVLHVPDRAACQRSELHHPPLCGYQLCSRPDRG